MPKVSILLHAPDFQDHTDSPKMATKVKQDMGIDRSLVFQISALSNEVGRRSQLAGPRRKTRLFLFSVSTHECSSNKNRPARSEESREESADNLSPYVLSQGEEQEAEDEKTVRGELQ